MEEALILEMAPPPQGSTSDPPEFPLPDLWLMSKAKGVRYKEFRTAQKVRVRRTPVPRAVLQNDCDCHAQSCRTIVIAFILTALILRLLIPVVRAAGPEYTEASVLLLERGNTAYGNPAKWRTVGSIPNGPSDLAITEGDWGLARYAAICQELENQSKLAAAAPVPVPQEAQVSSSECKPSRSAAPPSDGATSFAKVLQITSEDGGLGILGEYHLKSDLYDSFPRYEKAGVVPKNRKERRFLTHFNVGRGRWVVSDWEVVLLLGPVVEKQMTGLKAPDTYTGKYEVCKDVECRCNGAVKIEVGPVKDESKLSSVMHSSPSSKKAQELDEDARAVRKRFHEQIDDAVQDGTFEDSDADTPFAVPWAGQDQKRCEHCGKKGKFKCTRCNFTYYCSKAHQAAHRAKHQKV